MNSNGTPIPPVIAEQAHDTILRWHTRIIACLFLVGAIGGILCLIGISQVKEAMPFMVFVFGVVFALVLVMAAVGIFQLAPWGRTLGLAVSVPLLVFFPVGTAFGIYAMIFLKKARHHFVRPAPGQFYLTVKSVQADGKPTPPLPYDVLLARSMVELQVKTRAHAAVWDLDKASWSFDQDAGTITFTVKGGVTAVCPVQIVGTYSIEEGTFLWGWDHPSVVPALQEHVRVVKAYGEKQGIEQLVTKKLKCTEEEAWGFTALACMLAQAQGGYRAPTGAVRLFVTFGQPKLSR